MKIAVVTGSNKGIGNGIVELLVRHLSPPSGWDVYLTSRNEELGREAVQQFETQKGLSVRYHQLDISDQSSRTAFATYIKANYPEGLNILVNNAGIAYKNSSAAPFAEQARVTLETNYTANVAMCKEFLPLMAKNARLVNVGSFLGIAALHGVQKEMAERLKKPMTMLELDEMMASFVSHAEAGDHLDAGFFQSAYAMSKLGIWKATAILADQYKLDPRKILINSCCPGYVDTDMTSHMGHKTILEGADTPFYLATLSDDATSPYGEFVSERKVIDVNKKPSF